MSCEGEDDAVVDEDWSNIDGDLDGFVRHETRRIFLPGAGNQAMDVACVSSLSPLDMMNLSNGSVDATCHRIWMGAMFFIESLQYLQSILVFDDKYILELGCGTGISGIAIKKLFMPSKMVLTDGSLSSIDLTKSNLNNSFGAPSESIDVECIPLEWGKAGLDSWNMSSHSSIPYDLIVATDVIYDISALKPMMETAQSVLESNKTPGGRFVLVHVPRAALPQAINADSGAIACAGLGRFGELSMLEKLIAQVAFEHNLICIKLIRPKELSDAGMKSMNGISFQNMHEAGAALFIFANRAQ